MPIECDGSAPSGWQLGVAVGGVRSVIVFDGADVGFEQRAVSATFGRFATPRLGWTVSGSALVGGDVEGRALHGGGAVAAAVGWLPVFERRRRPFVAASASLGAALLRATADDGVRRSWTAVDLRLGVMVGKTFADRWVPYLATRAFGGPVFWHRAGAAVVGGDRYHVTVGGGLTVRLPGAVSLTAELMPLGERGATVGATVQR